MNNNFDFLLKFQKLQLGIGYNKLISLKNSFVGYSATDESQYSNAAFINTLIDVEDAKQIEDLFFQLNRKPSIYFENRHDLKNVSKFLEDIGYTKNWEDSWMFHDGLGVDEVNFDKVSKVSSDSDLDVFIDTFDKSYQKDDPNNPYGDVKSFIPGCIKAWHDFGKTDRLQYFVAFKDGRPVATSILNSGEKIGYISAVGSLMSVRGEGYGKLVTLCAVNQSVKLGNIEHCLATEEGTYPNQFYKRIGFTTRFTALGYCKSR